MYLKTALLQERYKQPQTGGDEVAVSYLQI